MMLISMFYYLMKCVDVGLVCHLMSQYFPNDQSDGIINPHVREGCSERTDIIYHSNKDFLAVTSHLWCTLSLYQLLSSLLWARTDRHGLREEGFIWTHGFIVHNPPLQNGSAAAGVCVRQLLLHPVMEWWECVRLTLRNCPSVNL